MQDKFGKALDVND